jgi:four helix bundle protein
VTAADAARHFAIARGSAMEWASVLDVILILGVLPGERHQQAIELLARVVSMVSKLSR